MYIYFLLIWNTNWNSKNIPIQSPLIKQAKWCRIFGKTSFVEKLHGTNWPCIRRDDLLKDAPTVGLICIGDCTYEVSPSWESRPYKPTPVVHLVMWQFIFTCITVHLSITLGFCSFLWLMCCNQESAYYTDYAQEMESLASALNVSLGEIAPRTDPPWTGTKSRTRSRSYCWWKKSCISW